MATSYGALCTDFYVNQKLTVKMDLPGDRETVLHYFDRIRKAHPGMSQFRRYENEVALESAKRDDAYRWLAMRVHSLRSGWVNPDTLEQVLDYHRNLLEVSPHYLTIGALDVDYLELTFGFDLECGSNHDEVVYEALLADSPLRQVLDIPDSKLLDVQPVLGVNLTESGDRQAYFEVRTRRRNRRGSARAFKREPISLFTTVRQYGPVDHINDLTGIFDQISGQCRQLVDERLIPHLLKPIARHITSSA
ncbi:MAG: hypothetical protein IT445_15375 [Phycisphaeraceae bacterium]|nr:hypothetical protein [Phycisphaeraceae bacterium]